jgi:DNA segregation ATPase FtsK/SpoIIIE, S-DNA-T family
VGGGVDTGDDDDPLLWEAADIVVTSGLGIDIDAAAAAQGRLRASRTHHGHARNEGHRRTADGSKPREVIVDVEDLEAIKAFDRQDEGEAV